ncbi:MAG: tyrosine--tRNA ligase [Flavobacteriales bacterium]
MGFVDELRWRGMLHDIMPETEELLNREKVIAYIGFDPTAESLHIGSMVQILLLMHLQKAGHQPIALVGGATGMVGDPSFKAEERPMLSEEQLQKNVAGIRRQLEKFLDFEAKENPAEIVNNYDWFKDFSLLDFLRDVGKHISVNYMMAKDSVKKRLETGISFTEFSYQLIQGYDFYWLWKNKGVKLQLGGSDQWGNIVTGTELIRRIAGGSAYALTCPLITKTDGSKFGKTEQGNVWLDPHLTSPYQFYQFWLNCSDEDAKRYIKIFTFLDKETIENLITQHELAPHERALQKRLGEEITTLVHGQEELTMALKATDILFGKGSADDIRSLNEKQLLQVFDGVPQFTIAKEKLEQGIGLLDFLAVETQIFPSKGEARKMLPSGAVMINREKVIEQDYVVNSTQLMNDKFILVQKGKKNYYLIIAE